MTDPRLGMRKLSMRETICHLIFEAWACAGGSVSWISEDGRIVLRRIGTAWYASFEGKSLGKRFRCAHTAAAAALKERNSKKGESRDYFVRHPGHAADRD
jgi:hypothetical protein